MCSDQIISTLFNNALRMMVIPRKIRMTKYILMTFLYYRVRRLLKIFQNIFPSQFSYSNKELNELLVVKFYGVILLLTDASTFKVHFLLRKVQIHFLQFSCFRRLKSLIYFPDVELLIQIIYILEIFNLFAIKL